MTDKADQPERLAIGQRESGRPEAMAEPSRNRVWQVRHMTHELAAVQNMLCPRRTPINIPGGGVALQVMLAGPMDLPPNGIWIACEINGHVARIGASRDQLSQLAGMPVENADPADAALLIEDALTAALDDIEAQLGIALRFRCLSVDAPPISMLGLSLRVELVSRGASGVRLHLPLQLSCAAGTVLAALLARWHAPRTSPLPFSLRAAVEIETARLSLGELRTLRPGDALPLPELPLSARILIEDRMTAAARPAQEGPMPSVWVLTEAFAPRVPLCSLATDRRLAGDVSETFGRANTTDLRKSAAATRFLPELDALEMRLSFRLGETLVPMADLYQAGPRAIVTLDRDDDAMIDIFANEQHIGTGEVIVVAGQRAVEIRNLFRGV